MDEKEGGGNEDGEEDKGGEIKQKRDVIHEEAGEQMLRGERNAREDVLHSHPHDEHGEHTDDDQDHDSPSLENSEENPLREESELDLRNHLRDDILESVCVAARAVLYCCCREVLQHLDNVGTEPVVNDVCAQYQQCR